MFVGFTFKHACYFWLTGFAMGLALPKYKNEIIHGMISIINGVPSFLEGNVAPFIDRITS